MSPSTRPNKKPYFKIGDPVCHRTRRLNGIVTAFVNLDDAEDVATQGFRYYVQISRQTWSMAESELLRNKKTNEISGESRQKSLILPPGASSSVPKPTRGKK